ncbi:conserved oligomeric Golgi complex subunit 8-like [Saccostrea cucullata]|uniref:conserved oligomeric Golgi complex subunit 8-like n=1 Tax=Saccostrea cuccullata TaxID=36930 RepID=UPI002ED48F5B
MDVEDENILAGIFKDSFPENWQENSDFLQYLSELSSYGVQKLSLEPDHLAEEKNEILQATQNLAFQHYKTFIETAECSRDIFKDFQIVEEHVGNLLEKLPNFSEECNGVMQKAQEINASRRMNNLTLQRHTQLLEILEMPQLMDTCVRNGYYEEALELAAHVKRLEKKHGSISIIGTIVTEVKGSTQLMLKQLIQQLRTNIQLPACLRVIGYIRRMDVFTETELRIKFLQARSTWFQGILNSISREDPYVHITKTIEASRVHLFDIITQYRAIFSDDDPLLSTKKDDTVSEASLFHGWVVHKISEFLATLEQDLMMGVGERLDSVLGQCMYFGLSFSRVGADFRGLLAPIFQHAAVMGFRNTMKEANKRFELDMQSYNLLAQTSTVGSVPYIAQGNELYPPAILLDYSPLAVYCNHVLSGFNELRLCAPVSVAHEVAEALQSSLLEVNNVILSFHRAEEATFDKREQEKFTKFCDVYGETLLPYLQKCLQALFPPQQLSALLGVPVNLLDLKTVLGKIEHLMPEKEQLETTEKSKSEEKQGESTNHVTEQKSQDLPINQAPAQENVHLGEVRETKTVETDSGQQGGPKIVLSTPNSDREAIDSDSETPSQVVFTTSSCEHSEHSDVE